MWVVGVSFRAVEQRAEQQSERGECALTSWASLCTAASTQQRVGGRQHEGSVGTPAEAEGEEPPSHEAATGTAERKRVEKRERAVCVCGWTGGVRVERGL